MRSSKSRQRNKPNRNRTVGNVVNRVFDSSGPEGKVRGTPQQIIEKYNQLARDAQLAGDRVATENFQQHAEHYLRLLSEAQKEQDARREEQERFNRDRQQERDRDRPERSGGRESDEADQPVSQDPAAQTQPDIIGGYDDRDIGLVETPESKPQSEPSRRRAHAPERGPRRGHDRAGDAAEPRAEAAQEPGEAVMAEAPATEGTETADVSGAKEAAAKRPRKPRAKRPAKSDSDAAATKAAE